MNVYVLTLIVTLWAPSGSSIHTSHQIYFARAACEAALLNAEKANRSGTVEVRVHGFCVEDNQ